MTETKETNEDKKLGLSPRPGKLELKKTVETGQVRQSFSHGRSKMVTVEVRKKRTFAPDAGGRMAEIKESAAAFQEEAPDVAPVVDDEEKPEEAPARQLTDEERAVRLKALEDARRSDEQAREEQRIAAEEEAARAAEIAARPKEEKPDAVDEEEAASSEEAPAPAAEPAAADAERQRETQAAADAERQRETQAAADAERQRETQAAAELARLKEEEEEHHGRQKKSRKADGRKPPSSRRGEPRRRPGKLTISEAFEDQEGRQRSLASVKRKREREKQKAQLQRSEGMKVIREVVIPEVITVQELANRMAERASDVIKILMNMDVMVTINQTIDADTAELVVGEFGHRFKRVSEADVEEGLRSEVDDEADTVPRAAVVTVMGHVDHGKTSLLDALRETNVASHEAGGITQHIGAYQVTMASGEKITFIDTPGHAAFTEMRSRGAQVTDIVVLCVAADDGIMPQTIEAIHHAKAAGVPIIVAINKMDRPQADANRVRTELLQHGIQVEDMGGDVLAVEVSALEKTNLDKLEEAIILQAELLDLKANPDRAAEGVIVESKMEQGRGTVATVLVQRGTLKVGDIFVAGSEWGRVRAMLDARGEPVDEAGPAVPVEVLGLNGTPAAGDEVTSVESEGRAREVTEFRQRRDREARALASSRGTLEQMFEKIKEGEAELLPVIIKADVHGSVEAISGALENISTDEVKVQVLHSAVGGINESDITLARASDAIILGFNVRANPQARGLAKRDNIEIRYYSIIYDLTDDLKKVLSGMLSPEVKETLLGYAEIREVFNVSKVGRVAGCLITEGTVKRGARVRLIRDEVVVHEGELSQLKRFKDDVKEVLSGTECGMAFANYQDVQAGDMIECFDVEEVTREL